MKAIKVNWLNFTLQRLPINLLMCVCVCVCILCVVDLDLFGLELKWVRFIWFASWKQNYVQSNFNINYFGCLATWWNSLRKKKVLIWSLLDCIIRMYFICKNKPLTIKIYLFQLIQLYNQNLIFFHFFSSFELQNIVDKLLLQMVLIHKNNLFNNKITITFAFITL